MPIADRIRRWRAEQWRVTVYRFLIIGLIIGMAALESAAVFPFPTFRWGWGDNGMGELGNFSDQDANRPLLSSLGLPAGVSLTHVSAGNDSPLAGAHSLALDRNRNVWAWGRNIFGQVGNGVISNAVFGPVQVCAPGQTAAPCTEFLSNISAIAAGGRHSLAVDIDSSVWAWGGQHARSTRPHWEQLCLPGSQYRAVRPAPPTARPADRQVGCRGRRSQPGARQ